MYLCALCMLISMSPAVQWGFSLYCSENLSARAGAQSEESLTKMTSRRAGPPDGGYGWVVVMSAFFVMGLTAAVLKNFGIFFLDIQRHFGVLNSTTSWVTSTTIAMFHLGGNNVVFF